VKVQYRCASLHVESPHRSPVVHRVECRNFIYSHGWHFQSLCNLVHDTDAREAELPLPKVKERHHGGFLILWWIAFEDLIDELFVGGGEFERYLRIIIGSISVLKNTVRSYWSCKYFWFPRVYLRTELTTKRASLAARAVDVRVRHWGRNFALDDELMFLQTKGRALDAIVVRRQRIQAGFACLCLSDDLPQNLRPTNLF